MSYEHYEKETVPCVNYATCKHTVSRIKREFKKAPVNKCSWCKGNEIREYTRLRHAAYAKAFPLEDFHALMEKYRKPDEPLYLAYQRFLSENL